MPGYETIGGVIGPIPGGMTSGGRMSKRGRKRKARKNSSAANHGKRPNS